MAFLIAYLINFSTSTKARRAKAKFDLDLSNTKYRHKPSCLLTGRNKWYCSPKVIRMSSMLSFKSNNCMVFILARNTSVLPAAAISKSMFEEPPPANTDQRHVGGSGPFAFFGGVVGQPRDCVSPQRPQPPDRRLIEGSPQGPAGEGALADDPIECRPGPRQRPGPARRYGSEPGPPPG